MTWMRQHSNSSMRSSHSVPEKKHTKGFLDFQKPKESKDLNSWIQTKSIVLKEQTLEEFKEMGLSPEKMVLLTLLYNKTNNSYQLDKSNEMLILYKYANPKHIKPYFTIYPRSH